MRRRHNLLRSTLAAAIDDNDTTITFPSALQEGGVNIATIASPDVMAVRIDDEILWITAYTAAATSATVTRGQEDTVAVAHSTGATVRNVATKEDFGSGDRLAIARTFTPGAAGSHEISWTGGGFTTQEDVGASISLSSGNVIIVEPGLYAAGGYVQFATNTGSFVEVEVADDESAIANTNRARPVSGGVTKVPFEFCYYLPSASGTNELHVTVDYDHGSALALFAVLNVVRIW